MPPNPSQAAWLRCTLMPTTRLRRKPHHDSAPGDDSGTCQDAILRALGGLWERPRSELEVRLQSDAYLEAIGGATKREITAEDLALTAAAFISGSVRGHDPAKFPGVAEFAQAYAEAMDAQFMCLGVSVGPNTVKLIEVRRDTPNQEVLANHRSAHPKRWNRSPPREFS